MSLTAVIEGWGIFKALVNSKLGRRLRRMAALNTVDELYMNK